MSCRPWSTVRKLPITILYIKQPSKKPFSKNDQIPTKRVKNDFFCSFLGATIKPVLGGIYPRHMWVIRLLLFWDPPPSRDFIFFGGKENTSQFLQNAVHKLWQFTTKNEGCFSSMFSYLHHFERAKLHWKGGWGFMGRYLPATVKSSEITQLWSGEGLNNLWWAQCPGPQMAGVCQVCH